MPTLQERLETATTQVETDSGLLHDIVHGDAATEVATEGGNVKSAAKAIADLEAAYAAAGVIATAAQAVTDAQAAQAAAEAARDDAQAAAASIDLGPYALTATVDAGLAGKADAATVSAQGAALSAARKDLLYLGLVRAVDAGVAAFDMPGGFVDTFTDESGVALPVYLPNFIPAMTGLTAPSGEVTAQSANLPTYPAWRAFTGTASGFDDGWYAGGSAPQWIQYTLPVGVTRKARRLSITNLDQATPQAPTNFTLAGSNDGSTWDTLLTVIGNAATGQAAVHSYEFDNDVAYNAYRLTVHSHGAGNSPNYPAIGNIALFEQDESVPFSEGVAYDGVGGFYGEATKDGGNLVFAASGNSTTNSSVGLHLAARFTMPEDGRIHGVDFWVQGANGTGYSASVWTDNGGSPGVRLGNQGTEVSVATTGIKNAAIDAPALTGGSQYWIVLERTGGGTGNVNLFFGDGGGAFDRIGRGSTITAITDNISSGNQWPLIQFYYTATAAPMTLVSNPFAAAGVPTTARLMAQVEPLEAIVPGMDLIGEISRDGGTTWTEAPLALELDGAGVDLFGSGETDLTAQPGGQSVAVRLRAPTGKAMRFHGWAVQH